MTNLKFKKYVEMTKMPDEPNGYMYKELKILAPLLRLYIWYWVLHRQNELQVLNK